MPEVYDLYNEYIYVNGKWEKLGSSGSSGGTEPLLYFEESITAVQLAALDITDPNIKIGYSYNIKDAFTTDSRFIEGPNISCQANTVVTVIQEGNIRYLNIIGKAFNAEGIEAEIAALQAEISAIEVTWNALANKPFNTIGEGLQVTNGALNATGILNAIANLRAAVEAITLTWNAISSKPFNTIGDGLDVNEDLELILNATWSQINEKPFASIGSGLSVDENNNLIANVAWGDLKNRPFNGIDASYFKVSSGSSRLLQLQDPPYGLYTSQMIELRNILMQ